MMPRATARRLTVFQTFSALSSILAPPELSRDAIPQLVQLARLEARDQHDDAARDRAQADGLPDVLGAKQHPCASGTAPRCDTTTRAGRPARNARSAR